jgi:hypothetical protein
MVGRALYGIRVRIGLFAAAVFLGGAPLGGAYADQVMRVGMTASDLPTTGGIPNNGGEGLRFLVHRLKQMVQGSGRVWPE